jgi:hypothetical protein
MIQKEYRLESSKLLKKIFSLKKRHRYPSPKLAWEGLHINKT